MQEFFDFECKFIRNCGNFALKTFQLKATLNSYQDSCTDDISIFSLQFNCCFWWI